MEINWFTVVAQVINFIILVWLLKRFLYKPILKAIEDRENKIVAQLEDAEAKKVEAKAEREEFQQKNTSFDEQKKELLANATSDAADHRQELFDNARTEAAQLSKKLATAAEEQRHSEQKTHRQKIQQEVYGIARKALFDLATVSLEEQLTQSFIKRLNALTKAEVKQLKTAFTGSSRPLVVRSAVALSEAQRQALKQSLDELLAIETSLSFEVVPALIGGMELSTQDYKIAWNISAYLRGFEKVVPALNGQQPTNQELKEYHV
ncbi:F0F1 ATP synthase subunit delta [Neolewinella antarctica]|uniref:ATP synthase subunit b n=1 Tax=Neolewinella antarctica TaxID=442734 RepID=A0ABX0XDH2_9BACT|nr:F0F1 ATP synthase subunit delta [Neolewinella antarctica]NJC26959.1 F-type H+-transporting ATPase subunit b [Neolewinella antarctica]